jgi:uncharacterized SAM-binding protein YcdF (DUF218 family)
MALYTQLTLLYILFFPSFCFANLQSAITQDSYQEIHRALDKRLMFAPNDEGSLFLKGLYLHATKDDDKKAIMGRLMRLNRDYGNCLVRLLEKVEQAVPSPKLKNTEYSVIIALGSPSDKNGSPKPQLLNTLLKTLSLAKIYPKLPIIVTGGAVGNAFAEGKIMKRWLIAKGIDSKRIVAEVKALDTIGNAKNSLALLPEETQRVLLVTVGFHMKRAFLIYDAIMGEKNIMIIPMPAANDLAGSALKLRQDIEYVASFRDTARALGYLSFSKGRVSLVIKDTTACSSNA